MKPCQLCGNKRYTKAAMVEGTYYKRICGLCLNGTTDEISSNAAGYERRRGYEDNAKDTIQPYDANGPNPEFARLYPAAAKKVFGEQRFNELRRSI